MRKISVADRRLVNTDPTVQRAVDEIATAWNSAVLEGLFHGGVIFKDVRLDFNKQTRLNHNLGRVPTIVLCLKQWVGAMSLITLTSMDDRRFVTVSPDDPTGTYVFTYMNILVA